MIFRDYYKLSIRQNQNFMESNQKVFSLTSPQIESKKRSNLRVRTKPFNKNSQSSQSSGHFQKHFHEMDIEIDGLQRKMNSLEKTLHLLNNAMENADDRNELIKQYEKELTELTIRLNKRGRKIQDIINMVSSFKPYNLISDSTTFSQTNSLSRPETPKSFQLPDIPNDRKSLINQNRQLIETSLSQERQILILKFKLRLHHDQREISDLCQCLNHLKGSGANQEEDSTIAQKLKTRVHTLRFYISREKERLRTLESKDYDIIEAVICIQKTWRGYIFRKKLNPDIKPKKTKPKPLPIPPSKNRFKPNPLQITPPSPIVTPQKSILTERPELVSSRSFKNIPRIEPTRRAIHTQRSTNVNVK